MNIKIDFDILGKKIGYGRVIYFNKLLQTLNKKNEVNFDYLLLPEGTLKKLRSLMVKGGIVKKCKLGNDTVKKYYLNPIYGTIVKDINTDLYEAFREINKDKIY